MRNDTKYTELVNITDPLITRNIHDAYATCNARLLAKMRALLMQQYFGESGIKAPRVMYAKYLEIGACIAVPIAAILGVIGSIAPWLVICIIVSSGAAILYNLIFEVYIAARKAVTSYRNSSIQSREDIRSAVTAGYTKSNQQHPIFDIETNILYGFKAH